MNFATELAENPSYWIFLGVLVTQLVTIVLALLARTKHKETSTELNKVYETLNGVEEEVGHVGSKTLGARIQGIEHSIAEHRIFTEHAIDRNMHAIERVENLVNEHISDANSKMKNAFVFRFPWEKR